MAQTILKNTQENTVVYPYIYKLAEKEDLTYDEMYQAFNHVLNGLASDNEIAALLLGLNEKGETVEEITALVSVLKEHAVTLPNHLPGVIDNCGTGGDGSHSFNISTTAAFVIAGAGGKIAKHGNKSVTSLTGSSDVLSALGIKIDYFPEKVEKQLNDIGIAFLFAPQVHPKIKQIMKVRTELSMPTIFNMIGPLINPVDLDYQYLGVYKRSQVETMAHVLKELGRKRAIVVNGAHHMDEANSAGDNHVAILQDGEVITKTLKAETFGLEACDIDALKGGDGEENKQILLNVLDNKGPAAHKETVIFNAGLALFVAEKAPTIDDGIKLAAESIETGKAKEKLEQLIQYTKETV